MRATQSIVSRTRLALVTGVLVTASALAACGAGGVRQRTAAVRVTSTPTRGSYVVRGASLPADRFLVDVVRERWPQLASGDLPRGNAGQAASIDRFGVYDSKGIFLGGPDVLLNLKARDVVEMRRLTAMEEYAKLGKRHPAGAVILTWKANV